MENNSNVHIAETGQEEWSAWFGLRSL